MAQKNMDELVLQYCAKAMLPSLTALKKKAQSILKRRNIEDIHDLRVSSRRLQTCINVFYNVLPPKKVKTWQREIKDVTRTFSQVRDLDVQINLIYQIYNSTGDKSILPGLRRIRLRLKQKRQVKENETQALTKAILQNSILAEIQAWIDSVAVPSEEPINPSIALYQLGYEHIQKRLDEFLFFEVFIFDPARINELHKMRIAAKRLRYTLEVFSILYEGKTDFAQEIARQSQQLLGEIHDADVWISYLPRFLGKEFQRVEEFYGHKGPFNRLKPGVEFLTENRKKERDRLYSLFLKNWREWKLQETWLNLRKVIFLTNLSDQQLNPDANPPQIPS
jgi:CHAD domain-containing protein